MLFVFFFIVISNQIQSEGRRFVSRPQVSTVVLHGCDIFPHSSGFSIILVTKCLQLHGRDIWKCLCFAISLTLCVSQVSVQLHLIVRICMHSGQLILCLVTMKSDCKLQKLFNLSSAPAYTFIIPFGPAWLASSEVFIRMTRNYATCLLFYFSVTSNIMKDCVF